MQLWTNTANLKDRGQFAAGWLQREELLALEAELEAAATPQEQQQQPQQRRSGAECKACYGSGQMACPLCSRGGEVIEL